MKHLIEYSLLENLNLSKKILNDLKIPLSNPKFLELREMLRNNLGFIGIFTKFMFVEGYSLNRLQSLYDELIEKKPYLGRLSKNISQYKKYEELSDDLRKIDTYIKFNSAIKELPSKLKQQSRNNKELYDIITSMSDLDLLKYIEFIKNFTEQVNIMSKTIMI